jgi:hypothetical protein
VVSRAGARSTRVKRCLAGEGKSWSRIRFASLQSCRSREAATVGAFGGSDVDLDVPIDLKMGQVAKKGPKGGVWSKTLWARGGQEGVGLSKVDLDVLNGFRLENTEFDLIVF